MNDRSNSGWRGAGNRFNAEHTTLGERFSNLIRDPEGAGSLMSILIISLSIALLLAMNAHPAH